MAVQFIQGFQSKRPLYIKGINEFNGENAYMMMKLPRAMVLRILTRSILLLFIFLAFSNVKMMLDAPPFFASTILEPKIGSNLINFKLISLLLSDLTNEGLYRTGDRSVFVGNGDNSDDILREDNMDFISINDLDRQSMVLDQSLDFAFTSDVKFVPEFIDRTLKKGGIVVIQLSNNNPFHAFDRASYYKIVYFRKFKKITILALRKTGDHGTNVNIAPQRRLLEIAKEERKAVLEKLEDVLLEPPRASSRKSSRYLKRTKYLPDLLGDSLESYPRRVFIEVGLPEKEAAGGTKTSEWFANNYPTRNLDFEMYKIETVQTGTSEGAQVEEVGMSDWLRKNVKEQEYVVMKAEAEVVEEMMRSTAISLVDELFLECKPQTKGNYASRRAYWECLALYGMLRDEGVAVHQWWG